MGFFNSENRFWQLLRLSTNILLLGVLWVILSITVVGFGPASTALYYAIVKSIRRERGYPFREFFRSLKENWWRSMAVGLLFCLLAWGVMLMDYTTLIEPVLDGVCSDPLRLALSLFKLFLLLSIGVYIFPILSRFDLKLLSALLLTIRFIFRNLPRTLGSDLLLALAVFLCVGIPEICLLIPGLCAYALSFCVEPVLVRYILESDIHPPEQSDPWYLE